MNQNSEQLRPLQFAARREGEEWSNRSLLDELLTNKEDPDSEGNWLLVRWSPSTPTDGGLEIHLTAPNPDVDRSTQLKLAELVAQKLGNGLKRASRERGWPRPRFAVLPGAARDEEHWTYRLELGPYRSDPVVIHPNKILAVGEDPSLSNLLGLECVDPVFGLSAKWITYSQAERASEGGCLLFEASEVLMSHAISFTQPRSAHGVGQWEVFQWAVPAVPSLGASAIRLLESETALLTHLIRMFIRENLHLPGPDIFLEAVMEARLDEDTPLPEIESKVRKEVVLFNLPRWKGRDGHLPVIEWEGPSEPEPEQHQRMLVRLNSALESASEEGRDGTPVLMVEPDQRALLANSLAGLFPDLPVLAWDQLEDLSEVDIFAKVSSELAVEPSVLPARFYTLTA